MPDCSSGLSVLYNRLSSDQFSSTDSNLALPFSMSDTASFASSKGFPSIHAFMPFLALQSIISLILPGLAESLNENLVPFDTKVIGCNDGNGSSRMST